MRARRDAGGMRRGLNTVATGLNVGPRLFFFFFIIIPAFNLSNGSLPMAPCTYLRSCGPRIRYTVGQGGSVDHYRTRLKKNIAVVVMNT